MSDNLTLCRERLQWYIRYKPTHLVAAGYFVSISLILLHLHLQHLQQLVSLSRYHYLCLSITIYIQHLPNHSIALLPPLL